MKKLLVFILLAVGAYFAYDHFVKNKPVLEIKADKSVTTQHSMDPDAPALSPSRFGSVQGTATNVSDNLVKNINLHYKLNGQPVNARIDQLAPGETKTFSTQTIRLSHVEVTFFLEDMEYE